VTTTWSKASIASPTRSHRGTATDDRVADELYSLPLEEFTAARNELAKQLEGSDAREVKSLKKPSLAAWTVNQLARRHPDELSRLFDLRDELGSGNASSMRAATADRKRLISLLTDHARSILTEAGHPAGAATLEGVSKTLLAGGTDEERDAILAGRLTRELAPSGFEGAFGIAPTDEVVEVEPEVDSRSARRAEELSKKATDAEAEATRTEREAEAAQKTADKLAQQAATARRKATEARHRADEALDAL
jgi:hypothetical protein